MGREIKVCRLFVQEEGVPMGRAHWRGSRADVVGDEGRFVLQHTLAGGFDIGLDPVKYGTQDSEAREGGIDVHAHDHVGAVRVGASEGELRGLLTCCGFC